MEGIVFSFFPSTEAGRGALGGWGESANTCTDCAFRPPQTTRT